MTPRQRYNHAYRLYRIIAAVRQDEQRAAHRGDFNEAQAARNNIQHINTVIEALMRPAGDRLNFDLRPKLLITHAQLIVKDDLCYQRAEHVIDALISIQHRYKPAPTNALGIAQHHSWNPPRQIENALRHRSA